MALPFGGRWGDRGVIRALSQLIRQRRCAPKRRSKIRLLDKIKTFMKPIIGVYLGWIPPHSDTWEPLYRTIRVPGGYQSDRTVIYAPTIARYPGLRRPLNFYPDPLDLPFSLSKRLPKVRPDYERDAKTLNLQYPNLDLFEYIGRTGGLFSGDPFTVFPIVEPNADGSYSYDSLLWKWEPEVRDSLSDRSLLEVVIRDGRPLIVTEGGSVLGELLPNFARLGDTISPVKFVRIGEKHYFGGGEILISFDSSINVYATPDFALAASEVALV